MSSKSKTKSSGLQNSDTLQFKHKPTVQINSNPQNSNSNPYLRNQVQSEIPMSALSQAQKISEQVGPSDNNLDWKYLWFFSDDSRSSTDNTTHSRTNESDAETQISRNKHQPPSHRNQPKHTSSPICQHKNSTNLKTQSTGQTSGQNQQIHVTPDISQVEPKMIQADYKHRVPQEGLRCSTPINTY